MFPEYPNENDRFEIGHIYRCRKFIIQKNKNYTYTYVNFVDFSRAEQSPESIENTNLVPQHCDIINVTSIF